MDTINKLNLRYKAVSIFLLDFSILYANIPHHKVESVMGESSSVSTVMIKNPLGGISRYGAIWTDS